MIQKEIAETEACFISQLDNGIIRVEKKLGVELYPYHLDENYRIYKEFLGEKKGLFLVIFQVDCLGDEDFRNKAADPNRSQIKKAEALVIKSLANRLESNFYINYHKPQYPIQIFTEESKAVEWLLTYSD